MTRPNKRELRESLNDLRENMGGTEVLIAWRDMMTGDLEDATATRSIRTTTEPTVW